MERQKEGYYERQHWFIWLSTIQTNLNEWHSRIFFPSPLWSLLFRLHKRWRRWIGEGGRGKICLKSIILSICSYNKSRSASWKRNLWGTMRFGLVGFHSLSRRSEGLQITWRARRREKGKVESWVDDRRRSAAPSGSGINLTLLQWYSRQIIYEKISLLSPKRVTSVYAWHRLATEHKFLHPPLLSPAPARIEFVRTRKAPRVECDFACTPKTPHKASRKNLMVEKWRSESINKGIEEILKEKNHSRNHESTDALRAAATNILPSRSFFLWRHERRLHWSELNGNENCRKCRIIRMSRSCRNLLSTFEHFPSESWDTTAAFSSPGGSIHPTKSRGTFD